MPKRRKQPRQNIFTRILIRLTIPLFILAAIVTAVLLVTQVQSINRYFQIESRLIFLTAQEFLSEKLADPEFTANPDKMRREIRNALPTENKDVNFSVYDLFAGSAVLSDAKPWTEKDVQLAENSLYQKRNENRSYLVRIDKEDRLLSAYLPHETADEDNLYVTRITYPLVGIEEALWNSRGILLVMLILIFLTGTFIGQGLAKSIVNPVRELNQATEAIMAGKLGKKVSIKTGDELEALAEAFNHMSDSLKGMKESAEDTNPLTHLPGNNGIKYELQRRIHQKQKFILFHSDLDRFKVFNDVFGLAKGDVAIAKTAELLKDILSKDPDKENFLGHQGGDDFVIIVKPARAKQIAESIVTRFDNEVVRSLYSKEDYERGYTEMLDRRGAAERGESVAQVKKFPLLGFSLAGISNVKRDFIDYNAVLKEAVKAKKEVKNKNSEKSSYIIVE